MSIKVQDFTIANDKPFTLIAGIVDWQEIGASSVFSYKCFLDCHQSPANFRTTNENKERTTINGDESIAKHLF